MKICLWIQRNYTPFLLYTLNLVGLFFILLKESDGSVSNPLMIICLVYSVPTIFIVFINRFKCDILSQKVPFNRIKHLQTNKIQLDEVLRRSIWNLIVLGIILILHIVIIGYLPEMYGSFIKNLPFGFLVFVSLIPISILGNDVFDYIYIKSYFGEDKLQKLLNVCGNYCGIVIAISFIAYIVFVTEVLN